ncbi:MAG: hypothetical protein PHO01_07905 [Desulfotomaculaceae bacterium]|nr:hypothetical protein [Desulfotomaculaceae bacterium]
MPYYDLVNNIRQMNYIGCLVADISSNNDLRVCAYCYLSVVPLDKHLVRVRHYAGFHVSKIALGFILQSYLQNLLSGVVFFALPFGLFFLLYLFFPGFLARPGFEFSHGLADSFPALFCCRKSLRQGPPVAFAIDAWGERVFIAAESSILVVICLLYAACRYFGHDTGLLVIMVCFVADQLLMAVTIARTNFLNRIVDDPGDLGPTISMGLTLNHAISMNFPFAGGSLLAVYGYGWVFIAAAAIAIINLGAAFFIGKHQKLSENPAWFLEP